MTQPTTSDSLYPNQKMSQSSDDSRRPSRRRSRGERERSKSESKKKRRHTHDRRRANDDGDDERRERTGKHSRHRDRDRERRRYRSRSRSRDRSLSNSDREEKDRERSHRRKRERERSSKHSSKKSTSRRDEKSSHSRKHKRSKRSSDRKRSRSRSVDKSRGSKHTSSSSPHIKVDLIPLGPISNAPPEKTIHPKNDYFAFHNHLRLFLYRNEKQTFFEDLSSDESHAAFERFCIQYNKGGVLEDIYYKKELPEDAMAQCKRTKHAWNFRTSAAEEKSLNVIKSGVKRQTQYKQLPPMVCRPIPSTSSTTSARNGREGEREARRAMIPPRSDAAAVPFNAPSVRNESQAVNTDKSDKESDDRQSKEDMLKSLGLSGLIKSGQKITIAPRK